MVFSTWDHKVETLFQYVEEEKRVITTTTSSVDIDAIVKDFSEARLNTGTIKSHPFEKTLSPAESFMKLDFLSMLGRKQYEVETGITFDIVVLLRPDLILQTNRTLQRFIDHVRIGSWSINYEQTNWSYENLIQSSTQLVTSVCKQSVCRNIGSFVQDVVVYGTSQVVDRFQECYVVQKQKYNKAPQNNYFIPHATVGNFLLHSGIKIGGDMGATCLYRNVVTEKYPTVPTDLRYNDSGELPEETWLRLLDINERWHHMREIR